MNIKRSLAIAGVTSGVALAALTGLGAASAASTTADGPDGLIDKIAQKFNLKRDDVKAVFDEHKSEREAAHQQKLEELLNQAVTDKKITSDQKDKILAKLEELKTFRQSLQDKTEDERHAAMEAKRAELEQWAKDNNIPMDYLRPFGHPGHKLGEGMRDGGPM